MITFQIVLLCLAISLAGLLISLFFSLIPGLHIYSILGLVVLLIIERISLEPLLFSALTVSMLIGYCFGSSISAVYFQTPDDSSVFMVFPSQKFMDEGRGYEAVILPGFGTVVGAILSCLLIIFLGDALVRFTDLITEHSLWIIATGMVFVWMSEWPKDPARQKTAMKKLGVAWLQLGMGLFVIIAAGILGIIMFFSQVIPVNRSFQGLGAAFVGLFAMPSLIQNVLSSKEEIPKQNFGKTFEGTTGELLQGAAAGVIGGSIGMLIPALTAGVGNSFSRHAVAQAGDRSFMFSQGVSRAIYYLGAVLLLFIPGVTIRRGGAALFITLFYVPKTQGELLIIAATIIIVTIIGWFVFVTLTKGFTKIIHKINTRFISAFGFIFMIGLTYFMLGVEGILIISIATAIGSLPILFNTRRVYCISVITTPIMISMAGLTGVISNFFGLA